MKDLVTGYFENVFNDKLSYVVAGIPSTLKQQEDKFRDPLKATYKVELMNAYAFDYIIRTAINKRIDFVLGRAVNTALYPTGIRTYKSIEAAQAALGRVMTEQEQRSLLEYIDKVDWITRIDKKRKMMMAQAMVGGRAACFIETIDKSNNPLKLHEDTPAVLKPLTWGLLGDVKINTDTWGLKSVHYDDDIFEKEEDKDIPADRLLYWTRGDYHVLPNQYLYGMSDLQPIMALSRTTRYINEMDLPEINATQWSGSGYWEIMNYSFEDTQAFLNIVQKAGRHYAFTAPVNFKEIKLTNDLPGLLEEREKNELKILTMLQTPAFLVSGGESITNRATADDILSVWDEGTLEGERDWLRDQMNPYYETLIMLETGETNVYKMKAKVILEFFKIRFESLLSKAQAFEIMINTGVIEPQEAREAMGFPPLKKSLVMDQELEGNNIQDMVAREEEEQNRIFDNRNKNVDLEPTPEDKIKARRLINSPFK